jgi:hypothetical protein
MKTEFTTLMVGLTNASQAPLDDDIFYRCELCGDHIASAPRDNTWCTCRNHMIDKEYVRRFLDDFSKFTVVRKVGPVKKKRRSVRDR